MKNLVILLFLVIGVSYGLKAQNQITISGKILNIDANKEGKRNLPFSDDLVKVFSYASKADAEASLKLMDEQFKKGLAYHGLKEIDIAEADPYTGYYEVKAYSNGWLLVKVGLSSELREVKNQLQINFNIRGAVALEQVVVKATNTTPNELQVIPVATARFGNVLPLTLTLPIGDHYGRRNARFVYQPFVVDCTTDSIEAYGRPYLLEGKEYHLTQERRMGYELSRDTLQAFVDSTKSLSKEGFILNYADTIKLKHTDRNYAVFGSFAFMDYNNIYYSKTTMVNTCRNILLMDFMEVPKFKPYYLNFEDYKKIAERKERPVPGEIQINFLINKAEPDLTDSATVLQLDNLVRLLNDISSGAVLKSLSIEGVASPDGNYDSNLKLAQKRTDFLQDFIAQRLKVRGYERKSDARVTSWKELADTVMAYDTILAQRLNRVLKEEKSHNANSIAVKKSGLMEELTPYLEKMRKVTYTCVYIVNRPLTPTEILLKYQANPQDSFLPYEYWNLFQLVKDTAQLEDLYKRGAAVAKAYENGRSWMLPECLLAASYINRDTFDVQLLAPLVDRTPVSVSDKRPKLNYVKRDFNGYETLINPEALVANYLIMCIMAHDYESASVAAQILNQAQHKGYEDLIAFALCMRGSFYNQPDVFKRVAATSPVNEVILNLMMGTNRNNAYAQEALEKISDKKPLYWYLKAVLADRMDQGQDMSLDLPEAVRCLVKCFHMDETFLSKALRDGSLKEATVDEAIAEYEMQKQHNQEGAGLK